MNGFVNVTPTSGQVVTTAEAKKYCDIASTVTGHDAELDRHIATATLMFQELTRRQLLQSTDDYIIDEFPCVGTVSNWRVDWVWYGYLSQTDGAIYIPRVPLQSVTSITYTDTNDTSQTLASSKYVVSTHTEPGRITLDKDESDWPDTVDQANAVTIRVVTGYSSVANIPADIKQYLLMVVRGLFKQEDPPPQTGWILEKYRIGDGYLTYG